MAKMTHSRLLRALAKSDFIMVGSQATGMADEKSDWDFAGQDSVATILTLESLGFTTVKVPPEVLDDITVSVWQRRLMHRNRVRTYQVALVKDLETKNRALYALMMSRELMDLDRSLRGRLHRGARKDFWNALFYAAGRRT